MSSEAIADLRESILGRKTVREHVTKTKYPHQYKPSYGHHETVFERPTSVDAH